MWELRGWESGIWVRAGSGKGRQVGPGSLSFLRAGKPGVTRETGRADRARRRPAPYLAGPTGLPDSPGTTGTWMTGTAAFISGLPGSSLGTTGGA